MCACEIAYKSVLAKTINTVFATSYITLLLIIVYYLLQYTVLNEYICGQWRSKWR